MRLSVFVLIISAFVIVNAQDDLCFVRGCTSFEGGTHEVTIGAFINDVFDMNVDQFTVRFDSYFWIKWLRCTNSSAGETFRPDLGLKLQNVLQQVDLSIQPTYPSPVCDADTSGNYAYMQWRVEGQFNQEYFFHGFPLDSHHLWMEFEDSMYGSAQLRYVADKSALSDKLLLSGWSIEGLTEEVRTISYATQFGANNPSYADGQYSNFRVGVKIVRGASKYVLRILPPIIITLAISIMVFLLDIEAMDTRIATAVGGLLAEIFLQLSFNEDLPSSVDYITLLDVVFDIAYVLILVVIIECVVIRSIYARLLLQAQYIKEDIQLHSMESPIEKIDSPDNKYNDVKTKAEDHKRRKMKIRLRIRRIERVFVSVFSVVVFFLLIIVSLIGRYAW